MSTTETCHFEHDGGARLATALAPQSIDQGNAIAWVPVCDGHASDWWDGSDWGPVPFRTLVAEVAP
jgi:hypothetical protein